MKSGKLVIFSAPSGAGKTTLVKHLLDTNSDLSFSISATSRKPRTGEVNGKDYYFLTVEDFKKKIDKNEFLEWEEVYTDQFYGTLRSEVQRLWNLGKHVVFDVDVKGGLNIKNQYKDQALAVFVMPPGIEILEDRLRGRSTEDEESLKKRIDKSIFELTFARKFDRILINDELEEAKARTMEMVNTFLLKK